MGVLRDERKDVFTDERKEPLLMREREFLQIFTDEWIFTD